MTLQNNNYTNEYAYFTNKKDKNHNPRNRSRSHVEKEYYDKYHSKWGFILMDEEEQSERANKKEAFYKGNMAMYEKHAERKADVDKELLKDKRKRGRRGSDKDEDKESREDKRKKVSNKKDNK